MIRSWVRSTVYESPSCAFIFSRFHYRQRTGATLSTPLPLCSSSTPGKGFRSTGFLVLTNGIPSSSLGERYSQTKRVRLVCPLSRPYQNQDALAIFIANLQNMAVAERREAEPTTGRRNEVGLAVRQATIELLAESCRLKSCKPITVSCRSHTEPLQPTLRFPEIFGPLAWA